MDTETGSEKSVGFDANANIIVVSNPVGQRPSRAVANEMTAMESITDLRVKQSDFSNNNNCILLDCSSIEIDTTFDSNNASDQQLKLVYEQEDRLSSYSMLLSSMSTSTSTSGPRPTSKATITPQPTKISSLLKTLIGEKEKSVVDKSQNCRLPFALTLISRTSETPRSIHSTKTSAIKRIKPKILFPLNEKTPKTRKSRLKQQGMCDQLNSFVNSFEQDKGRLINVAEIADKDMDIDMRSIQVKPVELDLDNYIKSNFKFIDDDYFGTKLEPLFSELEGGEYNKLNMDILYKSVSSQLPSQSEPMFNFDQDQEFVFVPAPTLPPGFSRQIIDVGHNMGDIFADRFEDVHKFSFENSDSANGEHARIAGITASTNAANSRYAIKTDLASKILASKQLNRNQENEGDANDTVTRERERNPNPNRIWTFANNSNNALAAKHATLVSSQNLNLKTKRCELIPKIKFCNSKIKLKISKHEELKKYKPLSTLSKLSFSSSDRTDLHHKS